MKQLHNERGGVLLYVIFILAMLLLIAPVLSGMLTARAATDITSKNETIAAQMTNSALETAVSEWNARIAIHQSLPFALSEYKGWTHNQTPAYIVLTLPDGTKITHSQQLCLDEYCLNTANIPVDFPTGDTQLYVRIKSVAGDSNVNHQADERYARERTITKQIALSIGNGGGDGGGGEIPEIEITDVEPPNSCYPDGEGTLLYGNNVVYPDPNMWEGNKVQRFLNQNVKAAIQAYLERQTNEARAIVAGRLQMPGVLDCSHCSMAQVQTMLNGADKTKPRVIKVNKISTRVNGNWTDVDMTLGSPTEPVILIVDEIDTTARLTLTVYGDLIVTGEGAANAIAVSGSGFNVTVRAADGSNGNKVYGNFYIMKASQFINIAATTNVPDGKLFFDGNLSLESGTYFVSAKQIMVNGHFKNLLTNVTMNTTGGNITFADAQMQGNVTFNPVRGDFFVRDDLRMENISFNFGVQGAFAIGGDVHGVYKWNENNIDAGGSNSSLSIPGITVPCR